MLVFVNKFQVFFQSSNEFETFNLIKKNIHKFLIDFQDVIAGTCEIKELKTELIN